MKVRKPIWWPILLSIPLMLGLVLLLHAAKLGTVWEDAGDALTFLLSLTALLAVVRMNERAMIWSDVERNRSANDLKVTVYLAPAERRMNRDLSHGPAWKEQPVQSERVRAETESEVEKWPHS